MTELYDFYSGDPAERLEEAKQMLRTGYLSVFAGSDALIAFRCFGKAGQVPGYAYDDTAVDTGGGLRPDLTGRGFGGGVIEAGLAFGRTFLGGVDFRVTVAAFNQRALHVLSRLGFVPEADFLSTAGTAFLVLRQRAC